MSLIYEALEKVEQDKKENQGNRPPKQEGALVSQKENSPSPKKNSAAAFWIAVLFSGLFFLGVVYFLAVPGRAPALWNPPAGSRSVTITRAPAVFSASMEQGQFSLTGITQMRGERTAIINNQLVRAGGEVDGAKVLSIEEQEVTLESGNQVFSLRLY